MKEDVINEITNEVYGAYFKAFPTNKDKYFYNVCGFLETISYHEVANYLRSETSHMNKLPIDDCDGEKALYLADKIALENYLFEEHSCNEIKRPLKKEYLRVRIQDVRCNLLLI